MSTEVAQEVEKFVVENFMFDDKSQKLDHGVSFLESGIIDSTGVLELVSFLEEHFEVKVEDDELLPEHLDSVNNVTAFVAKKRAD